MKRRARGFTLVEMLLAAVLAAILMGGVLASTAALSRDRRRMEGKQQLGHGPGMMELIRRDLASGAALIGPADGGGFDLIGHAGIDPATMTTNGRLVWISYRVARPGGGGGVLVREQAYLDDPIRTDRWREAVATGVTGVALTPLAAQAEPVRIAEDVTERLRAAGGPAISQQAVRVPGRVRVQVRFADAVVDQDTVLR